MKIYLAGPINGCTDDEANGWRSQVKALHADVLDPMARDYRNKEAENVDAIVLGDKADILDSDAVLVYFEKPSVGTSMEVLYAWENRKPVVIVNKSGKPLSPWLVYHSHGCASTIPAALNLLLNPPPATAPAAPAPTPRQYNTTDPTDPNLGRGIDKEPTGQNKAYLILSEEERAKGFVRPVRHAYRHVGRRPRYPLRDLTEEEKAQYSSYGYVKFEPYPKPNPDGSSVVGSFWTQADLDNHGCGTETRMGLALCETYARQPSFYGATYCCHCQKHLPVAEFIWIESDGSAGPTVGS